MALAVDLNGNIFISGDTYGNLDGNINKGSSDIFIIKYESNGNKYWTKLIGT